MNRGLLGTGQPPLNVGTLAQRPSAAAAGVNGWYFATDDNGGKTYRSDGSTWTALAPGATEAAAGADLGFKQITSPFSTSSSSMVDVTGLTSLAVTFPSTGAIWLTVEGLLTNNAIGGRPFYQVIDDLSTIYMTAAPYEATVASMPLPCSDSRRRITATAGTVRTYKVQLSSVSGTGTSTFGPAVLRATVAA